MLPCLLEVCSHPLLCEYLGSFFLSAVVLFHSRVVLTGFHHLTWCPWHEFLCFFCAEFFELLEYVESYFLPYVEKGQPLVKYLLSPLPSLPSGARYINVMDPLFSPLPIFFLCVHHLDSFYSSSSLLFFFF